LLDLGFINQAIQATTKADRGLPFHYFLNDEGMEVGPAQACAVKVVVHELKKKRMKKTMFPLVFDIKKVVITKEREENLIIASGTRKAWEWCLGRVQ